MNFLLKTSAFQFLIVEELYCFDQTTYNRKNVPILYSYIKVHATHDTLTRLYYVFQ